MYSKTGLRTQRTPGNEALAGKELSRLPGARIMQKEVPAPRWERGQQKEAQHVSVAAEVAL